MIASAETGWKLEGILRKFLWAAENTRKNDASARSRKLAKDHTHPRSREAQHKGREDGVEAARHLIHRSEFIRGCVTSQQKCRITCLPADFMVGRLRQARLCDPIENRPDGGAYPARSG